VNNSLASSSKAIGSSANTDGRSRGDDRQMLVTKSVTELLNQLSSNLVKEPEKRD
jgi:hypothetical protein